MRSFKSACFCCWLSSARNFLHTLRAAVCVHQKRALQFVSFAAASMTQKLKASTRSKLVTHTLPDLSRHEEHPTNVCGHRRAICQRIALKTQSSLSRDSMIDVTMLSCCPTRFPRTVLRLLSGWNVPPFARQKLHFILSDGNHARLIPVFSTSECNVNHLKVEIFMEHFWLWEN